MLRYLEDEKSIVVQVDAVASKQSAHFSECGFFAIDIVGWRIVFVGAPGNIELAVGDDIVVISFLTQRGRGEGQQFRAQQLRRESDSFHASKLILESDEFRKGLNLFAYPEDNWEKGVCTMFTLELKQLKCSSFKITNTTYAIKYISENTKTVGMVIIFFRFTSNFHFRAKRVVSNSFSRKSKLKEEVIGWEVESIQP